MVIYPNGIINTVYRTNSNDNTLFLTENCNHDCIMCSQPPKKKSDINEFLDINNEIIDLLPTSLKFLGITGGEPTLYGKHLGTLLNKISKRLPNCEVSLLTNAVLLSHNNIISNFEYLPKSKFIFCIPIYSDFHLIHDRIVNSKGAFFKTIIGIHNLAKYDFRIELRTIPQELNLNRLTKLAQYIYRNLTFVEHSAIMGIEYIGNAQKNFNKIWVSPSELLPKLEKAVEFLHNSGLNVSLFNYQNCMLTEKLRPFIKDSISDWKREYLEKCESCTERSKCGGIFYSSVEKMKPYINPI